MSEQSAVVDWNAEWMRIYAESSIVMRRACRPSYWDSRANRFSAMDNGASGRVCAFRDRLAAGGSTTVLDIGCGPGNLAVPLAGTVKSVTALDPSAAMLQKLEERAEREGVTNIRTVNLSWEDALSEGFIEPHDIVLSSYSLIMKDVGAAVAAMDATAREAVCLFWFAGRECFGYDRFWPRLFGEEYCAGPDHSILLRILDSMGIQPHVEIMPQKHMTAYADFEDAVACWAENLYVSDDAELAVIRELLGEILVEHEGRPALVRDVRTAMIWWEK